MDTSPRGSAHLAVGGTGADSPAPTHLFPSSQEERDIAGRRVQELPTDVLHRILHLAGCPADRAAGRPVRLACRRFRTAFGPFCNGLRLPPAASAEQLQQLASHFDSSPLLAHVHTLSFSPGFPTCTPALLAFLPHTFPALRSLHVPEPWSWPSPGVSALLSALAPLASTLTHLTARDVHPKSLPSLATTLSSLRSLHVTISEEDDLPDAAAALAGHLPHMQDLEYGAHSVPLARPLLSQRAGPLLSQLAGGLPHLTRLCLTHPIHNCNSEAAATLASAWPQLADLQLFVEASGSLPGAAAALANHTALTRLTINATDPVQDWELLGSLPALRELQVYCHGEPPWSDVVTGGMTALTRLALRGRAFVLDAALAGHLGQLGDSLLSLELRVAMPDWGHLAHLSCLSRLQQLTLVQVGEWAREQATTAEQVASELARGLVELQCLNVRGLRQLPFAESLVACLSEHGQLRELHLADLDPRWPARLAAMADTLARLSISYSREEDLLLLISSLKGLRQLHVLEVLRRRGAWSWMASVEPLQWPSWVWVEGSDPPATQLIYKHDPDANEWPEWGRLQESLQAAAGGGQEQGAVLLPPRLRVLVVDRWILGQDPPPVLQEAAARQGCVKRRPREVPAEWDDCEGYVEGASLAWLRRHGRL